MNTIRTVTSGRNRQLEQMKILAAGNADGSLENAQQEVQAIHTNFPGARIFVGDEATKKNVLGKNEDYNILHLATHGIMDYSDAKKSYILFAADKSNEDDGKLMIADIDKLTNLRHFRMVTLSACETAVIQNLTEGWPVSTATAFLNSGVSSVIATLWKVDDKATAILMEEFYKNLQQKMDKVEALQKAQIFLKNKPGFDDPYFWAPFQLVGLWE